ncbi:MAG: toll/interleukin-1 receptor domain-containing protein, partial [Cyanobacteria bacterium P01_A01_bin.135]
MAQARPPTDVETMTPFSQDAYWDAFISYGRADSKAFAQRLNDRLAKAPYSYEVWFDFSDIPSGVDYQKEIDAAIEKSDNLLFVISPHSVHSKYCRLEIELALKYHKRIIPVMHVEEIDRQTWQQRHPSGMDEEWHAYVEAGKHSCHSQMHPTIADINWIWCREGQDDFEDGLRAVAEVIKRERDYVHRHTVLLDQALTWQRNQQQTRYLLTGETRQQAEAWLAKRFGAQPPVVPTDLHCEYITESIKNGNNLMTQVFLAYAEQDKGIATTVRRSLMRASITTWSYHTDIEYGKDYKTAIARGVEEADNVVFLMSPDSLASEDCQKELALAQQLNKRLIIVRAGEVSPSQIPVALR